ncbi:transporter substrate-binding domain-containing protein [Rhodoligotrophos ferricapiens]|uniref:transporter substrate-binding domain-containing protein n=1 Tax=Rhodoligotrophos ferricapiens TaxID=3069264 RepID=UPI00315D0C70
MKHAIIGMLGVAALMLGGPVTAKEWTSVRIATEGAYAPWNFTEPSGQLGGYDVDVSRDLCRRMNVQCDIIAQDWDGIIPGLNAGKYDAIVAAMVITPKRQEAVDFTVPYAVGSRSFITLKTSPLAEIKPEQKVYDLVKDADALRKVIEELKPKLQGKVIGVQSATTHVQFMDEYLKGVAETREYKSAEAMILDLKSGRIDAVLDGIAFLGGTLNSPDGEELTFIGPRFAGGLFGIGSAIAVRKSDPELRDKFNAALKEAIADGTLSKLSQKWFKLDIAPQP